MRMIYTVGFVTVFAACVVNAQSPKQPKKNPQVAQSVSSAAQPVWDKEPEAVLGVRLGRPLADSQLPPCPTASVPTAPCIYEKPDRYGTNGGKPTFSVGGHGFTYITTALAFDESGVVSQLVIDMKHGRYAEFLDVLALRYGPPPIELPGTVQSKAGATYQSTQAFWLGRQMSIHTVERFMNVDDSAVFFIDNNSAGRAKAIRASKAASAAAAL